MLFLAHRHFTAVYASLAQAYAAQLPDAIESRTGRVRDLGPVVVELAGGGNRLAIVAGRALNPFFALAETAWILAGRRDVAGLQPFVREIAEYSDDGTTFHGAYGHRLRHHFGFDQIERAITLLDRDPVSRRVVLSLWSADDLGSTSKDVPCNVVVTVKVDRGCVAVTVFNRSNDFFRGFAYDVFAFSGLQSYLAARLRLAAGRYVHVTDSLHVYDRDHEIVSEIAQRNDATRLAEALDSLRRVEAHHAFAGIIPAIAVQSPERNPLASIDASYQAWKDRRFQDAVDVLPDDECGLAALLFLAKRRGFESCTPPSWFRTRSDGPWSI